MKIKAADAIPRGKRKPERKKRRSAIEKSRINPAQIENKKDDSYRKLARRGDKSQRTSNFDGLSTKAEPCGGSGTRCSL